MPTLHFSMAFDSAIPPSWVAGTDLYMGPVQLQHHLETRLGMAGYPENTDYFRTELYRQSLSQYLIEHPEAFFAGSFESDRLATAGFLLAVRDSLLLSGFLKRYAEGDSSMPSSTPTR